MNRSLLEKCYKDTSGNVVLIQFPNAPLITWAVATLLSKVLPWNVATNILQIITFGAIFTWAWLEIFQSEAYFRRLLGVVVLVVSVYSRI